MLFLVGGQRSLSEVVTEPRIGGKEGAGWTSDPPNLMGSLLHGWPDRVGRQVRLSNSKEGWLPWSVGPVTLDLVCFNLPCLADCK